MRMLLLIACASVVAAPLASPIQGQERPRETDRPREARTMIFEMPAQRNRAVLGITTSSGGPGDSLGVLVNSVTRGGPAERAGITEGSRIVAINDVNLRIAPQDAREGDMGAVLSRRLQREMARAAPGDEVRLRVFADGRVRDVTVTTVAASELHPESGVRIRPARPDPDRPMLGVSVSGSGSLRDTLGLFVSSVVSGGPAERAGIIEGYRIAEINGVSVRVPREDAEDRAVRAAMSSRFTRELQKVRPGDEVRLRVWADGRYRDVRVTAVAASELGSRDVQVFPGNGIEIRGGRMIRELLEPRMRELEIHLEQLQERLQDVDVDVDVRVGGRVV